MQINQEKKMRATSARVNMKTFVKLNSNERKSTVNTNSFISNQHECVAVYVLNIYIYKVCMCACLRSFRVNVCGAACACM